eukprot:GFUD01127112.1.p1 GENE.GFUD01127112.1~~GFUD01127112.1.p1  ORF type:complete len:220 (-),score=8.12 GFUD01127112.1:355-1014(-)
MCQLVLVLLALVAGYAGAASNDKGCCHLKSVGGVNYVLVNGTGIDTTGCDWDCVYEKVGKIGSRYCFRWGALPTICNDCVDCLGLSPKCIKCIDLCYPGENRLECFECISPHCSYCNPRCGFPYPSTTTTTTTATPDIKCPIFANNKFVGTPSSPANPEGSFKACQVQCKNNPNLCNFWSWDSNGIVGNQLCSMFEADTGRTFPAGWFSGSIVTDCTTG